MNQIKRFELFLVGDNCSALPLNGTGTCISYIIPNVRRMLSLYLNQTEDYASQPTCILLTRNACSHDGCFESF